MTKDEIESAVNLTLTRLDIPIDPKDAKIGDALKVAVVLDMVNRIKDYTVVFGKDAAIELIRATCDCMQLIMDKDEEIK